MHMNRRRDLPLLCPSSQPDHPDAVVFGVQVVREDGQQQVGYLTQLQPASPEILALSGPAKPTEVLRIAAPCAKHSCQHFDGGGCKLAARVAGLLNPVVSGLPRCLIRPSCLWFRQEGKAACLRCSQVVTELRELTELQREVAGPGAAPGSASAAA